MFFVETEKPIWTFIWNLREPQRTKTILKNKIEVTLPDFKTYCKATVIKIVWYCHEEMHIDRWTGAQGARYKPSPMCQMIFDKGSKIIWLLRDNLSTNGVQKPGYVLFFFFFNTEVWTQVALPGRCFSTWATRSAHFAQVILETGSRFLPSQPGPWPSYFMFSTIAGMAGACHHTQLLFEMGSCKLFFPWTGFDHYIPDFSLPRS
jgi:hypothetical protein